MSDSSDTAWESDVMVIHPIQPSTSSGPPLSNKSRAKQLHFSTMTAKQRAAKPGNSAFYADGNKLFCRVCSKHINHERQSVLTRHLESNKHKENSRSSIAPKRQRTIDTTLNAPNQASLENYRVVSDFVRMLASAKIPFNVANNPVVRQFLHHHVQGGGAIPSGKSLNPYLSRCFNEDYEKLKEMVKDKKIILIFDETTDSVGRYVCCVMFAIFPPTEISVKPILADVLFEESALDHGRVQRIILKVLNDFSVDYSNVIGFASDNVCGADTRSDDRNFYIR